MGFRVEGEASLQTVCWPSALEGGGEGGGGGGRGRGGGGGGGRGRGRGRGGSCIPTTCTTTTPIKQSLFEETAANNKPHRILPKCR